MPGEWFFISFRELNVKINKIRVIQYPVTVNTIATSSYRLEPSKHDEVWRWRRRGFGGLCCFWLPQRLNPLMPLMMQYSFNYRRTSINHGWQLNPSWTKASPPSSQGPSMHSAYNPFYNPPQKHSQQIHRGACRNHKIRPQQKQLCTRKLRTVHSSFLSEVGGTHRTPKSTSFCTFVNIKEESSMCLNTRVLLLWQLQRL